LQYIQQDLAQAIVAQGFEWDFDVGAKKNTEVAS
jgi:hypothetical protein